MTDETISPRDTHPRKRVSVLDSEMSYVDVGSGDPVVFLHGNPTWSYLWRNIIPRVSGQARCLAPDLIGMGESGRIPGESDYRYFDHARYLDAWFEAMAFDRPVTLVVHDWGSLGLYWANRHREQVRAVVYMETFVMPLSVTDYPEETRRIFEGMRSPNGEELVLERNLFIERVLPGSILRDLSEEEMQQYRKPWPEPGRARWPMLQWPREIPFAGEPADVAKVVDEYGQWLAGSDIPKLFVNAEPGAILRGRVREFCRTWNNQEEVTVPGVHFIQEDSPHQIGDAIAAFLKRIG